MACGNYGDDLNVHLLTCILFTLGGHIPSFTTLSLVLQSHHPKGKCSELTTAAAVANKDSAVIARWRRRATEALGAKTSVGDGVRWKCRNSHRCHPKTDLKSAVEWRAIPPFFQTEFPFPPCRCSGGAATAPKQAMRRFQRPLCWKQLKRRTGQPDICTCCAERPRVAASQ